MPAVQKGYLVLGNGAVFEGALLEGSKNSQGEVVFNTSAFGYEQILTDPTCAGQIVVMTYPLIGNYGINYRLLGAGKSPVRGFVIRELDMGEHYEEQAELQQYLKDNELACLTGVDTRAITRMIRSEGTMGGVITDSLDNINELTDRAQAVAPPEEGWVRQVTCKNIDITGGGDTRMVLIDFGAHKSLVRFLVERDCEVIIVPADTEAAKILAMNPHAIVLSDGPGDPKQCQYAVDTVKTLTGKAPIMGIGLGHQILALALGATTRKMKFGHRGGNHPVQDLRTGRIHITAQNHGYVVDENSLAGTGADILLKNINDGTVEGLIHRELPVMSVQFHPEASPAPQDIRYVIEDFLDLAKGKAGGRQINAI